MSAPRDKKALDALKEVADKNKEAGDWEYSTLPFSIIPVRIKGLTPEDVVKQIGKLPIPKRK